MGAAPPPAATPPKHKKAAADEAATPPEDPATSAADPRAGTAMQDRVRDRTSGPREPVVLAFAGDIHVEGSLAGLPDQPGSDLGALSGALRSADVAMVNVEAAIVDGDREAASKELEDAGNRYWFDAPPAVLGVLERSGVDVATVANNHGADYGEPGLRDTLAAGEDSPVAVVGEIGRAHV